ncbi:MAG: hypothetical protein L0Y72_00945 [Gemmataceae bacterium]|nr:hypothetical protein [Gemmataceae bacterium]MCI0737578.1 hypothetical protein [Gemmataceae bacterium]
MFLQRALVIVLFCGFSFLLPLDVQGGGKKPTKESAVQMLRDFLAALEAKDYDKAAKFLHFPPDVKVDIQKELSVGLERKEISKKGIDILAAKGKWGKLAEVFDKDVAERRAKRMQVPLDECYGLKFESAAAGFWWTNSTFKIIRVNNIGKLEEK